MTRPASLTVIAWAAIWLGMLATASGAMVLSLFPPLGAAAPEARHGDTGDFLLQHGGVVASVQLGFGLLVVSAGVALLRLKRWAAAILEVAAWLLLIYSVGFTGYFVWEAFATAARVQRYDRTLAFLVAGALFVMLFYGIPLAAAVYHLRRPANRRVMV